MSITGPQGLLFYVYSMYCVRLFYAAPVTHTHGHSVCRKPAELYVITSNENSKPSLRAEWSKPSDKKESFFFFNTTNKPAVLQQTYLMQERPAKTKSWDKQPSLIQKLITKKLSLLEKTERKIASPPLWKLWRKIKNLSVQMLPLRHVILFPFL